MDIEFIEDMSNKFGGRKLFVHETDCHGQGVFGIIGEPESYREYSFEDSETGDIRKAIQSLINIGFMNEENVLFIDGEEIYNYLTDGN